MAEAPATAAPKDMRTFTIIWLGELISMLGSGLTSFALGVWIFSKTGQATPFAITVLFGSLPRLLLLPVAGSLADRWNRRLIMILADTGAALLTLMAFLLLNFATLEIWHIYIIAAVGSVFAAFQEPAYTASISMIVPKENLARANGMAQMGQALESVITPLLAGALFVSIGLNGIIMIDFVTYFFAIGALLIVRIPQPKVETAAGEKKNNLREDIAFGWTYLSSRPGLFGLLLYFAMVNFLLNFCTVLIGPLILSAHPASVFGMVQTVFGVGMLVGGILMSTWGGPKQNRIPALIGFITISTVGLVIAGMRPEAYFPGVGLFIMMLFIPLASSLSQYIFQIKVAPDVQGRVFAMRSLIGRSMMPLAFLISGPLADQVFEPLMREGGALAQTVLGTLVGVGPGRGIGVMLMIGGLTAIVVSGLVYLNPRIRNIETEIPDAIPG